MTDASFIFSPALSSLYEEDSLSVAEVEAMETRLLDFFALLLEIDTEAESR